MDVLATAFDEPEVELSGAFIHGAWLQVALFIASARHHLGIVAGSEKLVGGGEFLQRDGTLVDLDPILAQKLNNALAGDAVKEGAVDGRRVNGLVLDHEKISVRELSDVADRVDHYARIKPFLIGFVDTARYVWIEATGLGFRRRHVPGRAAKRALAG